MNLKALNKNELDQRIKFLVQKEREILHEVLDTIKEIDCRKSYLEFGFSSLFDYLVRGVGYSEGSAQRRIDAARLLRELPQIAEKLQSGEIKLSQISVLQKAAREVAKSEGVKVTAEQKLTILKGISQKSHAQTQQQVAAFFDLPVLQSSCQKFQGDESVRLEFTLSKEAFAKVKHAQALLSHAVPTQDISKFLEYLADKVIQQKTSIKSKRTIPKANQMEVALSETETETETVAANVAVIRPSRRIAKMILRQQSCCQWIDPTTGRQCQSKWFLQIDHKQSQWAGGGHGSSNLQSLCGAHNRLKYRKETNVVLLS